MYFVGSQSLASYLITSPQGHIDNELYPKIAEDFELTFRTLKGLHCDIFLGAHGDYYGMAAKVARIQAKGPNQFLDPDGYKAYVADRELAFRTELRKQGGSPK